MVDVSSCGHNDYVSIELVSNLQDKRFVVLNEGWLSEFKDKNGVPKKKLVILVELLENQRHCYWVVNEDSLSFWKVKYGSDSAKYVGQFGMFRIKSIGGFNSIIGEPTTIVTQPIYNNYKGGFNNVN